jgi:hypothetical protein
MIDVRAADVVATERTSAGRFVIYTRTDVLPGWPVPWWGAVLDVGGDGFVILARIDVGAAPAGWTGRQLLEVALRRLRAEFARQPAGDTGAAVKHLEMAAAVWRRGPGGAQTGGAVTFLPGAAPSPYPWTVAQTGDFRLALCPDPAGREEGAEPEQVLAVLRRLVADAAHTWPYAGWAAVAQVHVAAALAAEARRAAAIRRVTPLPEV